MNEEENLFDAVADYRKTHPERSILQEAEELINGDRAKSYGDVTNSFTRTAKGWSVIIGKEITPRQVGLMMIWLKMMRETNNPKRDNLTDIAGYAGCIEKLKGATVNK